RALETARLEAAGQANLELARAARERLVRVQAAERERLAADLQRSAQQRLRTLEGMLVRLEAAAADPPAREQARVCRRELAEAVAGLTDRVRALRGDVAVHSPPGEGTRVTITLPAPGRD